MASTRRILVLATSTGGGNWPPLAAVTVGLHKAGHAVQCFGDTIVAQDLASAASGIRVMLAEEPLRTFVLRWREAGASGPLPIVGWAKACEPAVRAYVASFRPQVLVGELFTGELARLTKATSGVPYCFINPGYYFGRDSLRASERDLVGLAPYLHEQIRQAVDDADLVLHATDPLFDPPPPSLPSHHYYVGPLMWERPTESPAYLDAPGDPWVLVTLSSSPQAGEIALARTALQSLATLPVRTLVTLTATHPRDELGIVPANARLELFVPHSEVLKRSRLLVSHAGHGIVTKALYYGVPMVLVPWDRDQPGVAARAAMLGVAEVITREDLSEVRLSAAIRKVLETSRYYEKAQGIADRMQKHDAIAQACRRIEELMGDST